MRSEMASRKAPCEPDTIAGWGSSMLHRGDRRSGPCSDDFDRRANPDQLPQPGDVTVAKAYAALRGMTGYQRRFVGSMDAHDAAAGPLAECRSVGAGSERVGTIEGAPDGCELLGDVEVACRRGQGPPSHTDRRRPDPMAVTVQRGAECLA